MATGYETLRRIKEHLGKLGNFTELMRAKGGETVSIQSCATTVGVMQDAVGARGGLFGLGKSKSFTALACFELDPQTKVGWITKWLVGQKAVYIGLQPDHHFLVLPMSEDRVAVLQGFQGVYSVLDWMAVRKDGLMAKDSFINNITDLTTGDNDQRLPAAIALFSYNEETDREVRDYFNDKNVNISSVAFKNL